MKISILAGNSTFYKKAKYDRYVNSLKSYSTTKTPLVNPTLITLLNVFKILEMFINLIRLMTYITVWYLKVTRLLSGSEV